jgi:hypothetical protein
MLRAVKALDGAGYEVAIVIEKIRFNAATSEYQDLVKTRDIDPKKVTRSALQNASSIASLMLTTEAMVAEIPEKKSAAPARPGGHGPDMDYLGPASREVVRRPGFASAAHSNLVVVNDRQLPGQLPRTQQCCHSHECSRYGLFRRRPKAQADDPGRLARWKPKDVGEISIECDQDTIGLNRYRPDDSIGGSGEADFKNGDGIVPQRP